MLIDSNTSSYQFECKWCTYSTSRKSQYNRHLTTTKHKSRTNGINNNTELCVKSIYKCVCGKSYKYDTGYYRHIKDCKLVMSDNAVMNTPDLTKELIKDNAELKRILLAQQQIISSLMNTQTLF